MVLNIFYKFIIIIFQIISIIFSRKKTGRELKGSKIEVILSYACILNF